MPIDSLRRRGSVALPELAATWMEAAVAIVKDFVCCSNNHSASYVFWNTWESVCVAWNASTSASRSVSALRLLSDCSLERRVHLWRVVLSVPENIDEEEFNSVLMDGSYTAWAEISRDSRRTYAAILRTRPNLHLQLTRILHALATRFVDVGYCQGMNFVACTILLAISGIDDRSIFAPTSPHREESVEEDVRATPDTFIAVIQAGSPEWRERIVFKICEKLFVRNHFVRIYEVGLFTRLFIWTFDKLVESVFPDLHTLITKDLQVSADFYTSTWFMTLFSADLDLHSSIRVLDLFVAKGPKFLHRFGLACLSIQEIRLVEAGADVADGLRALRGSAVASVAEVGVENLIQHAMKEYKCITNSLIADLQTAGKVHGGASLVFVSDQDTGRRSGIVVVGDTSPSGTAFETEWNKEEAQVRRMERKKGKVWSKFGHQGNPSGNQPANQRDNPLHQEGESMLGGGTFVDFETDPKPSKAKSFKTFIKKKLSFQASFKSHTKGYSRPE